jgi:hypothetical protein|tara:strand:+ start:93 stop:629 length:537 start_codon:yes stop_codon:yes gene_type:complete
VKELIIVLMIWIGGHTGFPIPDPPRIIVKTQSEIRHIAYECDKLITEDKSLYDTICSLEYTNDPKTIDVLALYDHTNKTIYLPTYFDKDNMAHRAILLHELVHHLQYQSGYNKKIQCLPLLEKQAYDLMDMWLDENKAVMPPELSVGPLLRFMLTNCMMSQGPYIPEDDHYVPKKLGG